LFPIDCSEGPPTSCRQDRVEVYSEDWVPRGCQAEVTVFGRAGPVHLRDGTALHQWFEITPTEMPVGRTEISKVERKMPGGIGVSRAGQKASWVGYQKIKKQGKD
jgi:hypothetical protein